MIFNCRNGPLSANHDCKKNYAISRDHKLQKRVTFYKLRLQENYTISPDRELQKRAMFCKSQSQEILYNFSQLQIAEKGHFLQIRIAKRNYTISPDHKLQKRVTFCK